MMAIKSINAKEVLDSRGNPTVEAEVITEKGVFRAIVPSGASTGDYEAVELRDNDKSRYSGKGVLRAVSNIKNIISKKLIGLDPSNQDKIDDILIKLDGTKNKSRLGANAILAVSMAVCRAGAAEKNIPLYEHIKNISGNNKLKLPVPNFNILNGGLHAKNKIAIQEFMILPTGASSFKEAFRIGTETYNCLKKLIKEKYGIDALAIGDEGGFAPSINSNEEALELVKKAICSLGYDSRIKIGIDAAASEFYDKDKKKYNFNFKNNEPDFKSWKDMINIYENFINRYNLISIEDPFDQDDWRSYKVFSESFGKKIQIVGDDLLATNLKRIKKAIKERACNTLLLKINQVGTISEAISSANLSKKSGWRIMVSHRSGESEDSFIADLAVGIGAEEIKSGAPFRMERLAKYNRLLIIEKELEEKDKKVIFSGEMF